ncbi:MAG: hypothetical protein IT169_14705 [Bryobacterales bacterium]|nr:hypothetical protein [Bryobacterales bacterium]
MSDTLQNAIRNFAGRVKHRRGMGILKKTPGTLGEPPALLDAIEANTVYVGRREIEVTAEREVLRYGKNLAKAGPRGMQHRVDTIAQNLTLLRTTEDEPSPHAGATFPFTATLVATHGARVWRHS